MSVQTVATRRVHYVSGFDPRGAAYYLRLYEEEAARQASLLSAQITVGGRKRIASRVSAWQVDADWPEGRVRTDYQFMHWDDIIREHWEPRRMRLVGQGMGMYLAYLRHRVFGRIRRTGGSAFYTFVAPLAMTVVVVLCMVLATALTAFIARLAGAPPALTVAISLVVAVVTGWAGLGLGERTRMFWLLRISGYLFHLRRDDAALTARLDAMAAHVIAEQARDPVDEVIIVGHSVGTILAVQLLARVLAGAPDGLTQRLSLVTLGQCIPLLSYLPGAAGFRADTAAVAADASVPWFDVTAAADPLCFFDVDPVAACGVAVPASARPKRVAARFFRMFGRDTYRRIQRDKMRLHFQYLMASELPTNYDFFRLTAGPLPITAQL